MITRFTNIVNGLEALGKTYKELEKVMKILRSLPSKWDTKGHCNSRSQRLDQAIFGGAHGVIDDI
ncbi:hypothetical protein AAG906_014956 [Vitis piasezkii]